MLLRCPRALVWSLCCGLLPLRGLVHSAGASEPPGAGSEQDSALDLGRALDAGSRPLPASGEVTFNLERVDLAELTRHIAALTKRRFIYDSRKLSGIEASVVSPAGISVEEAFAAYLTLLEMHDLSVVQQGEFWKIVEGPLAGAVPPLHDEHAPLPPGALPITHLHRVEHVRAGDAAALLGPFASQNGDVSAYEPGRMLIITDTGAHVARLLRLLQEIDVERAGARLWVEPVYYARATRVAEQLNGIFAIGQSGAASLLRVVADDSSNRLLIIGTDAGYASVIELLRRIDVAPAAEGRVHVVALEHAMAEELEQTLSRLLADMGSRADSQQTLRIGSFEGAVRVTADKATNALIVNASAHDYAELRPVIAELDRRPRQVFIDAVVLELSSDDRSRLGLGFHGAGTASLLGQASSLIFGGVNAAQSTPDSSLLQALALGVRGPDVEGSEGLFGGDAAGLSIPAFGVALQALALSSTSDVLATPHIIALDNTTAEISVGDNIPLQVNAGGTDLSSLGALLGGGTDDATAAASAALGAGGTPRQDVGTRIRVTPHINEKNQVRLEIEEEISQAGTTSGELGVVSVVQRSARTSVVVDDEQTVVIGGLVRDMQFEEDEKVPFLGDLPLLGALFRKRSSHSQKTNLILILTPHVIDSREDLQRVFERKMEERQEFLDRFFVFNSSWDADSDLSRESGLVEKVRQALRAGRERRQLELDRLPAQRRGHEPSAPIEMPPDVSPRAVPSSVPVSQHERVTSSRTG